MSILSRVTSDFTGHSYNAVTERLGGVGLECSVYVLHEVLDFGEISV
ncbi:MAG: hypothetical protein OSB36_00990 [Longimicrobiales bacterium]|nr:hypothetical protein [Longimicrobiales bacterium]